MTLDWNEYDNRDKLDHALAQAIVQQIQSALAVRPQAYIVLSGGSTPLGLFTALARYDLPWAAVSILLADERAVAANHPDSNERLVRHNLMQYYAEKAEFLSFRNPETGQLDRAYANAVLAQIPDFDAVILGMGADAHTASLFPGATNLERGLSTTSQDCIEVLPPKAPHARLIAIGRRLGYERTSDSCCSCSSKIASGVRS